MVYQTFRDEYFQMPSITRAYTTAIVITTLSAQLGVISPLQLYFNPSLIFNNWQIWRLVTSFVFFGYFGLNFLFHLIFIYYYCCMLEENSFRDRMADFIYMFLFGGTVIVLLAPLINLAFLGHMLAMMLIYVESRRNPCGSMSFFGLMTFQPPRLPIILLIFSVLLGNSIVGVVLGMAIGHIYFYLEDVYPHTTYENGCVVFLSTLMTLMLTFFLGQGQVASAGVRVHHWVNIGGLQKIGLTKVKVEAAFIKK